MSRIVALEEAVRTIPNFPRPGIEFKDITPLLAQPRLLDAAIQELAVPFADRGITRVLGIESRGFILGAMLARHLGAGFVPVRKQQKLPAETYQVAYDLEYGSDVLEMHVDAVEAGDRVLIHDDVIATGGTAAATYELARESGAAVLGYSFLIELTALGGRNRLRSDLLIHAVLQL